MSFRFTTRRLLLFAALIAVLAAACGALFRELRDGHPRAVTKFLANIEKEYREGTAVGGDKHAKEMIQYVQHHYSYEILPSHAESPTVKELGVQRKRTIEAIEDWLDRPH